MSGKVILFLWATHVMNVNGPVPPTINAPAVSQTEFASYEACVRALIGLSAVRGPHIGIAGGCIDTGSNRAWWLPYRDK